MLMLSGFFLTKEPHIHTLVESWTWSWDCCGHGQTEWETLYQKGTQTQQRRLVVSLWMYSIWVKPGLGIGKLMSWGSEGVAAAGDATRLTWPRSGRGCQLLFLIWRWIWFWHLFRCVKHLKIFASAPQPWSSKHLGWPQTWPGLEFSDAATIKTAPLQNTPALVALLIIAAICWPFLTAVAIRCFSQWCK